MIDDSDIACLVFASGASVRFGGRKMLHPLKDGLSILATTIRIYRQVFRVVNVVVNDKDLTIIDLVESEGAVAILNPRSSQGLSQSVVAGVELTQPKRGWLCALGDMPYVWESTVESVADRLSESNIVVPRTKNVNGNPVAIGSNFRAELLQLDGDIGAKPLINQNAQWVHYIDCNDPNIHRDIDRRTDLF